MSTARPEGLGLKVAGWALALAAVAVIGCEGPEGEAGPMGPQGAAGADGAQGLTGPVGPAGSVGPAGAAGEIGDLTCTQCHSDDSELVAKSTAWSESVHGTGEAYVRGSSSGCAGCHSGAAFSAMVADGLTPNTVAVGDSEPTRQDCRTCHAIHTSYTDADWALETTAAVDLYAIEGTTYDGGKGNLCVNCHQPRRAFPEPDDAGMITGISSHWGPHHGPQSAMMLGVAGAGVTGRAGVHYTLVENTCVTCHMGEGDDHTFEPDVAACEACHADASNFDIGGVQTEVQAMVDELGELLLAAELINENGADGHAIVTEAPVAQATALYNWIYVAHEDKSMGVHNPAYAKALLQAGIDAMQ